MTEPHFEWDQVKDAINQLKHGVAFIKAQFALADYKRLIVQDNEHSQGEQRFYCIGLVDGGILTVRFTYRNKVIRIYGAGYWRKGKALYESKNQIQ